MFSSSSTSLSRKDGAANGAPSASAPSHRSFLRSRNSSGSISNRSSRSGQSEKFDNAENHGNHHSDIISNTSNNPNTSYQSNDTASTDTTGDHEFHNANAERFLKKLKHTDSRASTTSTKGKSSATSSPTANTVPPPLPDSTTSDLFKKYGPIGKLLGTGASGSVNLVTAKDDPTQIFAVKKFRSRMPQESETDYKVKVKNEFKIGDYLKHENLICTIELIKDYSSKSSANSSSTSIKYYIVMEYCPYDFFNLVMSGLMSTEEVCCYFRQIVSGVAFLHENGLAHRDLKLDNCVVSEFGILKLIDFGSAVQFRKEITDPNASHDDLVDEQYTLVKAKGIVGSDPYLSPEVLASPSEGYDPRAADVWSVAVIFCCMILKRFPWKIPRISDPSYRSFVGAPSNASEDPVTVMQNSVSEMTVSSSVKSTRNGHHSQGPERLMRLLPEASRELVRRMLILDPANRILMADVLQDDFINSIEQCHMFVDDDNGNEIFVPVSNHTHHLVTEEDLQKLNQEKERVKKLKNAGMA
ncbi:protein kinase [Scheffersomyces stipitis CBS 6054]|uniref:non-specific serine/threonine protein kinase n=1 Tax=Scheffersomyces stipitis (strain ATCC 58785 / CBS 6054 / NBRC 10063 / NRRL Y-11545) TaxID=322104 RepID=A3LYQ9_PICST|nr:protein kinase [Scheffersomyces stipitis CBS 6054]ABN68214.2 protein kinase [Scheffersomyces stipitis CBS 6054]